MTDSPGVLWAGPIFDRGGYGNVSRNYVRSLLRAKIPVRSVNLGADHREVDPETMELVRATQGVDVGAAPIAVVHYEPMMLDLLSARNVGGLVSSSIFETHSIPDSWIPLSNRADQVWIPSRFNKETYSRAGVHPDKLRVVPIPADCEYFRPGLPREPIPGAKGFVFLYVFSFGWRKGFDLLLKAYLEEFKSSDDVTLFLKVYPGAPHVPDLEKEILSSAPPELHAGSGSAARVVVHATPIPQAQLRALYAACDLYVSTDRANGWGMPCMEAMSMGKACATIDWSGSTEFMTEENSFLIRPLPDLEPVDPRLAAVRPDLYSGQKWPKVDVGEIRRVLRRAYEAREELREKGERAAQDMREKFSFDRVGAIFREVLEGFPSKPVAPGRRPVLELNLKTRIRRACGALQGKLRSMLRRS